MPPHVIITMYQRVIVFVPQHVKIMPAHVITTMPSHVIVTVSRVTITMPSVILIVNVSHVIRSEQHDDIYRDMINHVT